MKQLLQNYLAEGDKVGYFNEGAGWRYGVRQDLQQILAI